MQGSRVLGSLLFIATLHSAAATEPNAAGNQASPQPVSASSEKFISVTFNTSTTKIIQGSVLSMDTEIENISNSPVSVDLDSMQLAVQPELAPADVLCTWFYEPSAVPPGTKVLLQPGDKYTVFFDTAEKITEDTWKKSPDCRATWWGKVRKRVDFLPGNYTFVLEGVFSTVDTKSVTLVAGQTSNVNLTTAPQLHSFISSASFPVGIDQAQIVLYAGIGGLLAWIVMKVRNKDPQPPPTPGLSDFHHRLRRFMKTVQEILAAMLVSITVTIVASRLSTTTFPIKVSVDDFWGALTVGFVSYFVGGKFIDKLAEGAAPNNTNPPANTTGTTQAN